MPDNKDIAVLANKVYELSTLPVAELDARKWEALLILNAVYSSATQDGIAKANADKEARWGNKIREEGILYMLHPKWHLRTDDGKPPAARFALQSALTNPHRDLRSRLAALMLIPESDRGPLTDLVRALNADAWDGALTDARLKYSDVLRGIDKFWTKNPWLTVLPHDGSPPIMILIDNQGVINDGSIFDKDPTDDPLLAAAWDNAIRTWDIDFLRDNPLAVLFTKVETGASNIVDTAGDVADGAQQAAKNLAKVLAWAPYVVAGIGTIGLTTLVLTMTTRRAKNPADELAGTRPGRPRVQHPYRGQQTGS
ncbi:MAG: hypothetical protein JNL82_08095 [Myxococcales bacterium]|nr:hypothetical protein [Myxococcales bacterium]